MDQLEKIIREIVGDELDKRQQTINLMSVSEFCKKHSFNRTTVWRLEKQRKIKTVRLGKKVFVDLNQFSNPK